MARKEMSVIIKAYDSASAVFRGTASSAINSFARIEAAVKLANKALGKLVLAPGDSLLVQGLDKLLGGAVDELDKIGKLSRRLGLTTEELSKLSYAANLSNVDLATLAGSVGTLEKNLGQFAITGGGKAAEAIKLLRQEFSGLTDPSISAFDKLPKIAEALLKLPTDQRNYVAQALFGDQAILTLVEGGKRGLNELFAEAQKLGNVYTRNQTDIAEHYADSVTRIGRAWMGVKVQVLEAIGPTASNLADRLAEKIAQIPSSVKNIGNILGSLVNPDPQARDIALRQLQDIAIASGSLFTTVLSEAFKVAAITGVTTFEVLWRAAVPGIADSISDALRPVLNKIPYVNIAQSLRGELEDAQKVLDQNGPELRSRLRAIQDAGDSGGVISLGLKEFELDAVNRELTALQDNVDKARQAVDKETADRTRSLNGALQQALTLIPTQIDDSRNRIQAALDELGRTINPDFVGPQLDQSSKIRQSLRQLEYLYGSEFERIGKRLSSLGVQAFSDFSLRQSKFLAEYDRLQQTVEQRRLRATGQTEAADRLEFLYKQQEELDAAKAKVSEYGRANSKLVDQIRNIQSLELRGFDLDAKTKASLQKLIDAQTDYREGLADRAALVQSGTLAEFQATRQNLQSADSLRLMAERTLEAIDALKKANPEFAQSFNEARKTVVGILRDTATTRDLPAIDTVEGITRGLRELVRRSQDFGKQGEDAATQVGSALTNDLGDAIFQTGQNFNNLKDIARNFAASTISSIGRVASQMLALRLVGSAIGLFTAGGSQADVFNSVTSNPTKYFGTYARGAAFSAGRVVPFAGGGVVTSPTYFPMAKRRVGLMGEAGPEAIMPLVRTRGGGLGVRAAGGAGNGDVHISIVINGGPNGMSREEFMEVVRGMPRRIVETLRSSPQIRSDMKGLLA